MPPNFVSHVLHVFFSHGLMVYLSTYISGGYHVMFEPGFPSDVYSTWVFSHRSMVYISMRNTLILFPWKNSEPGTSLTSIGLMLCVCWC